jgi:hypothetical protein
MLGAAYLAAILLPLLLVLGSFVTFAVRRLEEGSDPVCEAGPPAPVTELRPAEGAPVATLPSLPIGFRYDAVTPGPLQVVDAHGPTTKVCPDCAETVLHSARVCKHCRYRFDPPLSGSHAV